jgi:hypothetical protein
MFCSKVYVTWTNDKVEANPIFFYYASHGMARVAKGLIENMDESMDDPKKILNACLER